MTTWRFSWDPSLTIKTKYMATANFYTKSAQKIYFMDEWSAEDFEEIVWNKDFCFWGD